MNGVSEWHSLGLISFFVMLIPLAVGLYRSTRLKTELHQEAVQRLLLTTAAVFVLFIVVTCFYVGPTMLSGIAAHEATLLRMIVISLLSSHGFGLVRELISVAKQAEKNITDLETIHQPAKDTL